MSEAAEGTTTIVIKCKCMSCSLHFTAYSFHEKWRPAACPECGRNGPFMVWVDESTQFIYEFVPGTTSATSCQWVSPV